MARPNRGRGVRIFSSDGTYIERHEKQSHISHLLAIGELVLHHTGQYRLPVVPTKETPSPHSPTTITYQEIRALVGEFGDRAARRARKKLRAWQSTHDTKAVVICAGRVCRPEHDGQRA